MSLAVHPPSRELEAAVLAVVREIPAGLLAAPVHTWVVAFGTDWSGDEAFFVRAVLDVETIPPGAMTMMSPAVREAVDRSGVLPGAWTYLSLRTAADPGDDAPG